MSTRRLSGVIVVICQRLCVPLGVSLLIILGWSVALEYGSSVSRFIECAIIFPLVLDPLIWLVAGVLGAFKRP